MSRPAPKPPFGDACPISSLTSMNPMEWDKEMERSGYRASEPAQYTRIINGILNGVDVEFTGDRSISRTGANLPVEGVNIAKVSAVIAEDVRTGKKAGPFDSPPFPIFNVSPIGCVPKKDSDKIRVIHHLSYPFKGDSINESVVEEYLPLSRFADAAEAVRRLGRGCFLIKLDVEAAYKQVPVRREDWPLLGFRWQGKYYYERVLPFGLKSSCRLWDWYAAALHYFFQQRGIDVVIHYIDDFLFVIEVREHALAMRDEALALCKTLGIPMAANKTEGPCHRLTFLGVELDTDAMRARLPDSKLANLKRLTAYWGSKTSTTVKELQSLAGVLQFATYVVRPGRFFVASIWDQIKRQEKASNNRHEAWPVAANIHADVAWWAEFTADWNGISLLCDLEWSKAERIELFTDACMEGYGALFGREWFASKWSSAEIAAANRKKRVSMPFFELYALVTAAATWGHQWTGKRITFRCDCMPVVQCLNSGHSDDPGMMSLLRHFCLLACRSQFDFRCEHIPGVLNRAADILSRDGPSQEFRALCPLANERPVIAILPPLRA